MRWLILSICLCSFGCFQAQTIDTFSVYFPYNESDLPVNENQKLEFLKTELINIISLEGHTDSVGSIDYNIELSMRRVSSVKKELSEFLKSNTLVHANGETESANSIIYNPEKCRRVDILYSKVKAPMKKMDEPEDDQGRHKNVETFNKVTNNFISNNEESETLVQLSILFYNNSRQYLPESEPELIALVDFMKENPDLSVHIRGHICCVPNTEWDDLSEKRAYTVYSFLMDRGISLQRMSYKGYGTSKPFVYPEKNERDERLNRRVDLIFKKK